jgi:hypothetical protein
LEVPEITIGEIKWFSYVLGRWGLKLIATLKFAADFSGFYFSVVCMLLIFGFLGYLVAVSLIHVCAE